MNKQKILLIKFIIQAKIIQGTCDNHYMIVWLVTLLKHGSSMIRKFVCLTSSRNRAKVANIAEHQKSRDLVVGDDDVVCYIDLLSNCVSRLMAGVPT